MLRGSFECGITVVMFLLRRVQDSDGENGVLVKDGVSVECWNKFLLKNHLYKGMLWFEDGKVCILCIFIVSFRGA